MQALYYAAMMYFALIPAPENIHWQTSAEQALAQARIERKPALILYLFGRLDEKFT